MKNCVSEQMIKECYEEYRKGNRKHVPKDMNATSAKRTVDWLNCLFLEGKPIHFNGSVMQCKLVLEYIEKDCGEEWLSKAKSVLKEYCDMAKEKYKKPCHTLRKLLSYENQ